MLFGFCKYHTRMKWKMRVTEKTGNIKRRNEIIITLILLLTGVILSFYIIQHLNAGNHLDSQALQENQDYEMINWNWSDDSPDYRFFTNANQWHYHITANEMAAACVLLNYSRYRNVPKENWELRKMYSRYDENYIGVSTAFVKSESGREVYFFMNDTDEGSYLVIADIVKGNSKQTSLANDSYSYDSSLEWYSYKEILQENNTFGYKVLADEDAFIYDAVFIEEGAFAMAEFLKFQGAEKKQKWYLLKDNIYIGVNGYLADLWYSNGTQEVHMVVDVWNKLYTVVEII